MSRSCIPYLALAAIALSAWPSAAQDPKPVEVIPYVAAGTDGASPVGAAVTLPLSPAVSAEVDVAYRRGEGDINALSSNVSLLFALPRVGASTPYLAGGIGVRQYGSPLFSGDGPPVATQPRLAVAVNAGGGVKLPVTNNLGLRTDARWFKSFGNTGTEQFRVAQGISFDVRKR